VRTLARRSALNDRAENDRVIVADMPALEAPRTREIAGFLGALELAGKTLILTNGKNQNIYLSARNLGDVQVLPFGTESVYDVLWANTVIIERSALDGLEGETEEAPKKARKAPAKKKAAAKAEVVEAAAEETTGEPEAEAADASDEETEEKSDA
jgi:hypothetical protein